MVHPHSLANLIPGGHSLSKDGSCSPQVKVRLGDRMLKRLRCEQDRTGWSMSKIVRVALDAYLPAEEG